MNSLTKRKADAELRAEIQTQLDLLAEAHEPNGPPSIRLTLLSIHDRGSNSVCRLDKEGRTAGRALPHRSPRIEIAGGDTGADHVVFHHRVSAEYFSSLGIPLRQGRLWSVAENATVAHVAVVNDAMARQFWPSGNAIGQRVRIPDLTSTNTWNLPGPRSTDWLDVIGVVGNVPNAGLADLPLPALFIPWNSSGSSVSVRGRPRQHHPPIWTSPRPPGSSVLPGFERFIEHGSERHSDPLGPPSPTLFGMRSSAGLAASSSSSSPANICSLPLWLALPDRVEQWSRGGTTSEPRRLSPSLHSRGESRASRRRAVPARRLHRDESPAPESCGFTTNAARPHNGSRKASKRRTGHGCRVTASGRTRSACSSACWRTTSGTCGGGSYCRSALTAGR